MCYLYCNVHCVQPFTVTLLICSDSVCTLTCMTLLQYRRALNNNYIDTRRQHMYTVVHHILTGVQFVTLRTAFLICNS
jgi:hypothetical protein